MLLKDSKPYFLRVGLKIGLTKGLPVEKFHSVSNSFSINEVDIDILTKPGVSREDITHSVQVVKRALEIAVRTHKDQEMERDLIRHPDKPTF